MKLYHKESKEIIPKVKQRNYTKNEAKKMKSDNLTMSNRGKLNFVIAIFEKLIIR